MEVMASARGHHLIIRGPGMVLGSRYFATREALLAFTREQELELLAGGYRLHALTERRVGSDRRRAPRPSGSDRRRPRDP